MGKFGSGSYCYDKQYFLYYRYIDYIVRVIWANAISLVNFKMSIWIFVFRIFMLLFLHNCQNTNADEQLHSQFASLRGFNLTNWLNIYSDSRFWSNEIPLLRKAGYNHIRIPISQLTCPPPNTTCSVVDVASLKDLVKNLNTLGFSVSLDFHPNAKFYEVRKDDPELLRASVISIWHELSLAFAEFSTSTVYFEVWNEPNTTREIWRFIVKDAIDLIRSANSRRIIIVGPPKYQGISSLLQTKPFEGGNVVYAVHFYAPMLFTHQGATWTSNIAYKCLRNISFPVESYLKTLLTTATLGANCDLHSLIKDSVIPYNEKNIDEQFKSISNWATRNETTVIVNEFGVLKFYAPANSRTLWLKTVRQAAESQSLGWVVWDYSEGFGIMDESNGARQPNCAAFLALTPNIECKQ